MFHNRYVHPGNMIVAVSGDFDRDNLLMKLENAFSDWPIGETGPTTFPAPKYTPQPGVYMIDKPGVNQGRVSIGHRSVVRGSPDEFALQIMNGILGGAGFRSRLFARVRSDEGLAYNTGSRFHQGVYYPEDFICWFQSKNNSCAYAAKIVLDEIRRLREEPVSEKDVQDAIAYFVESFPQRFPNKMAILETYVDDEYTGRDPNYWQTYLDNLRKVTPEDVRRVARKYVHPDQLVILAVGDADAIFKGGYDKAPDLTFAAFGPVKRLPPRDPDTLKRR
ncbi:MAG: insulinase family protein [Planctomycetota bacterium]|nr:MAG: insulinase family protein [Planctomycetota bacterium]